MQVVICPICKGGGEICTGVHPIDHIFPFTLQPVMKPCHGCNKPPHGSGWIVIPDVLVYGKKGR